MTHVTWKETPDKASPGLFTSRRGKAFFAFVSCLLVVGGLLAFRMLCEEGTAADGLHAIPLPAVTSVVSRVCSASAADEHWRGAVPELAYYEVLLPFLSGDRRRGVEDAIEHGAIRPPRTFFELASNMMETVGGIDQDGNLDAFYKALLDASRQDSENLNILRMLVMVSSFRRPHDGEYEKNLARLARCDTNADVILPYAQCLVEEGEVSRAYSWIDRSISEHPAHAATTLAAALRLFVEAKAEAQTTQVLTRLKTTALTPMVAHACGRVLQDSGDAEDAAFFYSRNAEDRENPYYREAAQLYLSQIKVEAGSSDEQTVATLKRLTSSDTPAIRAQAHGILQKFKIEIPGIRHSKNANASN